jgi:hypothetical protein
MVTLRSTDGYIDTIMILLGYKIMLHTTECSIVAFVKYFKNQFPR